MMNSNITEIQKRLDQYIVQEKEAYVLIKRGNILIGGKRLSQAQAGIRFYKNRLDEFASNIPITIVEFGIQKNPRKKNAFSSVSIGYSENIITDTAYYITHDDEEIAFLIKRDFGDELPLTITKIKSGKQSKTK